jgi:hypothetical protein
MTIIICPVKSLIASSITASGIKCFADVVPLAEALNNSNNR